MEFLGYISSVIIGLSLGLLGAGGSILTIPVIVYFFGKDPLLAIKYSLFIVGTTSLTCLIPRIKKGEVLFLPGIIFAAISISVVALVRKLLIPNIPEVIAQVNGRALSFGVFSMLLLAMLMISCSFAMLKPNTKNYRYSNERKLDYALILSAISTGFLTGFLGAGGGFIIVPALVLFLSMDIEKAIGTSLLIISMNTLSAFAADLSFDVPDWNFMLSISALSCLGCFVGQLLSRRIDTAKLKSLFGKFMLLMGVVIFTTQSYKFIIGPIKKPFNISIYGD